MLDLALEDGSGLALLDRVRASDGLGSRIDPDLPVIVLSGRSGDADRVRSFARGADDHLAKPFSYQELLARVRAVLRRAHLTAADTRPGVFEQGDLRVEFSQHQVKLRNKLVPLTPTEYRILAYLARNAGRVVTQPDLLSKVWGPEYKDEAHLLRVNIARLRQKVESTPSQPRYILTRPGIGYSLARMGEAAM